MFDLPGGSENDVTPNRITSSVTMTAYMQPTADYHWKVTVAWWKEFIAFCRAHGLKKIAIEEFPCMMVHNPESFWHLREAFGDDMIGINLDPFHLIAYDADPICSARAMKDAIYHVHGKNTRIERGMVDVNGLAGVGFQCEQGDLMAELVCTVLMSSPFSNEIVSNEWRREQKV